MLSVKEFAVQYNVCPSWARRQIKAGHLSSTQINGHYFIAPEEAERWLSEQPYRGRVRNISHPRRSVVVLSHADFRALYRCGRKYNAHYANAHLNMELRVTRLRKCGFNIDQVCTNGLLSYRLKDIVEIDLDDGVDRFGPHPDFWNEGQLYPH